MPYHQKDLARTHIERHGRKSIEFGGIEDSEFSLTNTIAYACVSLKLWVKSNENFRNRITVFLRYSVSGLYYFCLSWFINHFAGVK